MGRKTRNRKFSEKNTFDIGDTNSNEELSEKQFAQFIYEISLEQRKDDIRDKLIELKLWCQDNCIDCCMSSNDSVFELSEKISNYIQLDKLVYNEIYNEMLKDTEIDANMGDVEEMY